MQDQPTHSDGQISSLDIELEFGQPGKYEKELVASITAPNLEFNKSGELILFPIVNHLKHLGFPIHASFISYYSPITKTYCKCGQDPLGSSITLPIFEIVDDKVISPQLKIKCRTNIQSQIGLPSDKAKRQAEKKRKNYREPRRPKERKIGYIIEKVSKWRKLYNGVKNDENNLIKMSLEEAAGKVGICKKSLDDYLLQIRFGKKFGFNFHEHRDERVGILRAYVKKYKSLQPYIIALSKGETIPDHIHENLLEPATPVCTRWDCCISNEVKKVLGRE